MEDLQKPEWLKIKPPASERFLDIRKTLFSHKLHTVCQEAHCPNIPECWSGGTATFMILGDTCTRGCRFCAVKHRINGESTDPDEPKKLAEAVKEWGLDYVVVTSVDRDDLPDQGSGHFAACIRKIKELNPDILVEVLTPDFKGNLDCIKNLVDAFPNVFGHNIETVERLQKSVRDPRAHYRQSLNVLKVAKELNPNIFTKSSLMLGLGESEEEIIQSMKDLRSIDVDFLTLGQYLRPSDFHLEVKEYIHPEKFQKLKETGESLGFKYVAAGPFVRSSYMAGEFFVKSLDKS